MWASWCIGPELTMADLLLSGSGWSNAFLWDGVDVLRWSNRWSLAWTCRRQQELLLHTGKASQIQTQAWSRLTLAFSPQITTGIFILKALSLSYFLRHTVLQSGHAPLCVNCIGIILVSSFLTTLCWICLRSILCQVSYFLYPVTSLFDLLLYL